MYPAAATGQRQPNRYKSARPDLEANATLYIPQAIQFLDKAKSTFCFAFSNFPPIDLGTIISN
jgi:hypothetical protein